MLKNILLSCGLSLMMIECCMAQAQAPVDEARIEALLKQLDAREKAWLLSGANSFGTAAVQRLGIRGMRFVDGAGGVRSNDGEEATAFPAGIGMAATWNPALLEQIGSAIGKETRAMDADVLLGPNLNLVRSPLAGRNFETYGEDPWLAGQLGVSFVRGVQGQGVGVSIKHFIGNEQETERNRSSSNMDARVMHELYLAPFETVVRQAHPWTVMAAYNRLNGTYMSENQPLLRDLLKQEWGFDGVVMSDWGGTHSTSAVAAGLDLEMPGPPHHLGDRLLEAVNLRQVPQAAVDEAARRMLRLSARVGALDQDNKRTSKSAPEVSTAAHRALARVAAAQSVTLLKNEGNVLPLQASQRIAVIGPNADSAVVSGGGSALVIPSAIASPLDALRLQMDKNLIRYEQGTGNEYFTPAIDGRDLSPTRDRKLQGLAARYYANGKFAGKPMIERIDRTVGAMLLGNDVNDANGIEGEQQLSVRWQGYYWPRVTGDYLFEYEYIRVIDGVPLTLPDAHAEVSLTLQGRRLLHADLEPTYDASSTFFPMNMRRATVHLQAGRAYPIAIDYATHGYRVNSLRIAVRPPVGKLADAVAAARAADVALVFVGSGTTSESEGRDRSSLALYGEQDALVRAVVEANPRTVVVLNNGGPVAMPWADQVPAIVEAWLPGQEGAHAIADVLLGKVNPSGKLPVSFPKRLEDSPSFPFYPGWRDAFYGESLFMGYRYYDKKQVEPLFAFGHGLSYTTFEYTDLELPANVQPNAAFTATVTIRNTGQRAGAEVVQAYVSDRHCAEMCPLRELKAFERIELQPGEARAVTLKLDARALAHYEPYSAIWQTTPGRFVVAVGSSSRDLRLQGEMTVPWP